MVDSYMRLPPDSPGHGVASRDGSRPFPPVARSAPVASQQPPSQHHVAHNGKVLVPKQKKDLSKGAKRYYKQFFKWLANVKASCGIDSDDCFAEPLTIETLEDAVRDPDAEQVERLLAAGVQVNDPIDERGSTVLDALASEFLQMLEDCDEYRYRGVGSDALTEMFVDHNRAFHEVTHLLQKSGATMSAIDSNGGYLA